MEANLKVLGYFLLFCYLQIPFNRKGMESLLG
jgi:hypothetical protein